MKKITLLFIAIVAFSFQSYAQDTCATATAVTPGTITGTTITDATGSADMTLTGTTDGENAAWFVYTATADGTIDVSSCGGGADTDLGIGTGTCGALTDIVVNDDSCDLGTGDAWASQIIGYNVVAGADYYIEWSDEWEAGPFDWTLTYTPPPACGDATDVDANAFDTNSDFSWVAPVFGTPTGYNWEIQPDGVAQGTAGALASGTTAGTTVNSGAVLTASTAYEFYVQTDCGVDGTSDTYATVGFTTAAGPAPANDDFANAEIAVCGTTYTGSTVNATLDEDYAGEPAGGADFDAPNVWFSFTGSGSAEEVTLSLCNSDYDTAIMVFTGTSGNLTQVAQNEDSNNCGAAAPESYRSFLTFNSDGTTTYYIAVEGWNVGSTGNYDLAISCVPAVAAPANDLCGDAEGLTIGVDTPGTTVGAGVQAADNNPSCESTLATIVDVWYSFTATASDMTVITTLGSADQANVAVYDDCTLATQIGCSDANDGETLGLTGLTVSNTYLVRVWNDGIAPAPPEGEGRVEGDFTISVDVTLSTNSFENENAFTYFPNPVKNELTLNAQKDIQNVSVYNMLGQEVLRTAPNTTDSTINMETLSQGAYFVQVTIGNAIKTVRVIKQ